jgi:tetratricopeptide (TPR) repeat protein
MKKILITLLITLPVFIAGYFAYNSRQQSEKIQEIGMNDSIYGNYLSARFSQKNDDFSDAVKYLEALLKKDPENNEVLRRAYSIYLLNGDFDKAVLYAKKHISDEKAKLIKKSNSFNSTPFFISALDSFRSRDFSETRAILDPMMRPSSPRNNHIEIVVIPMLVAWSYAAEGEFNKATTIMEDIQATYMLSVFSYQRAIINDLSSKKKVLIDGKDAPLSDKALHFMSDIFTELGNVSFQRGDVEEAIIYYRLCLVLNPDSFSTKKMLAIALENQKRFEDSNEIFSKIPKDHELYLPAQIEIAINHHRAGKTDEAISQLKEIAEVYKSQDALLSIAHILMEKDKFSEAITYLNQAISKLEKPEKKDWAIFYDIGICYDKDNQWDRAEASFKIALGLNPNHPEVLNYLAYSWIIRGVNIEESKKMLENAVIASAGAPHILDSYGWALFILGEYNDALPFLEQAAILLPYNPVINDHLGDLYWKLGRKNEARFQWQKSIDFKNEEIDPELIQKKILQGI